MVFHGISWHIMNHGISWGHGADGAYFSWHSDPTPRNPKSFHFPVVSVLSLFCPRKLPLSDVEPWLYIGKLHLKLGSYEFYIPFTSLAAPNDPELQADDMAFAGAPKPAVGESITFRNIWDHLLFIY